MGDDKLPTQRVSNEGIDGGLSALAVDHCYDGWAGVAHLRDDVFDIRVRSNLSRIVVFTTPGRDSIAIEPVSHVNNALALADGGDPAALGLVTLGPGESLTAQMTIEVERGGR
jgi:aldose 1-epimerase